MEARYLKKVVIGLCVLLITSVSYAKCYPGLDCPNDLPGSHQETPRRSSSDNWQMISHYKVKGNLVKDITTGLIWMRCSVGQKWRGSTCEGKPIYVNWDKAMAIPKHLGSHAGYSDWRLPTIKELITLVYYSNGETVQLKVNCGKNYQSPTIEQSVFPLPISGSFWSASPDANNSSQAWLAGFNTGYMRNIYKNYRGYVRLVRTGQ